MSSSLGFTAALLGAIVMGMTCGAGCSPAIGMILGNYVVQADGEKKKVIAAFSEFYWGKAAASNVSMHCGSSSWKKNCGSRRVFWGLSHGFYYASIFSPVWWLYFCAMYMEKKKELQ